jgi:hypothetical protein
VQLPADPGYPKQYPGPPSAAYPLFYDTLFASFRKVLADAAVGAQQRQEGLWASDATLTGVDGSSVAGLEQDGVIAPKRCDHGCRGRPDHAGLQGPGLRTSSLMGGPHLRRVRL